MHLRALIDGLSRHRHPVLACFDAFAWAGAAALATLFRLDFDSDLVALGPTLLFAVVAAALFTVVAWATRLHDGRAQLGSLDELIRLAVVNVVVGGICLAIDMLPSQPPVPRSVPIIAPVFALVIMSTGRIGVRVIREHVDKDLQRDRDPVVLVGVCESARQLIRSMRTDPHSHWRAVGIVDDDPHNRYLRIEGVPVLGSCADLPLIGHEFGARIAVVADPHATSAFLHRVSSSAGAGMSVKVLPGLRGLFDGRTGIRDIRDIVLTDLLGRRQLDTDLNLTAEYLVGSRVLVTGAGGSIGSELCRQLSRSEVAELIMVDRDESALHEVQLSISRRALLDSPNLVLADIRDARRIREIFAFWRPDIVFHAAALKHLPLLEQYPHEAVKTNVWGTLNVLEAALDSGVQQFVNISTDKAANPISVLGYSKRITERLTARPRRRREPDLS